MKTAVLKLTFLILAVSIAATAQTTDPTKQSEITFHNLDDKAVPLFVFTYFDPWRKIYGADMPEFALYQDGTVIFTKCRTKDHYSCFFRIAKLSADETAQLMNKLLPQAFNLLKDRYTPGGGITVSDLSSRLFVMRQPDGDYKHVSTYGPLSGDKPGYVAENVPDALREILEFLTSYENPRATELRPDYYEVVIGPYSGDSKKNLKWPKDLPGLSDPKTIKHSEYDRYSLFVSDSQYEKLRDINYKLYRSKAALLINDQRWDYELRTPFPSEAIWLGDFRGWK